MIPLDPLFDLLPAPLLDRLAVQFAVNRVNQVKLAGQTVFLCLLNTLVSNPVVSQRLLKATYEQLTGQNLDQTFRPAILRPNLPGTTWYSIQAPASKLKRLKPGCGTAKR